MSIRDDRLNGGDTWGAAPVGGCLMLAVLMVMAALPVIAALVVEALT